MIFLTEVIVRDCSNNEWAIVAALLGIAAFTVFLVWIAAR